MFLEEKIIFPELWFDLESTKDKTRLGVQMDGKPKALSDRNLNSADFNDQAFVFSDDFIRRLKEEFGKQESCAKGILSKILNKKMILF